MEKFLTAPGDYKNLLAYKKALCVFDGTIFFTRRFYKSGDRTIGQMEQAARSGKQNIIEGNVDGATSTYSNIHLLNIALGSLEELMEDYIDYLRINDLKRWSLEDYRCRQTRKVCAKHNEPEFYLNAFKTRSPETIANIMIVIIMQCITLTGRLLASRKREFLTKGGKKESMYKARVIYRSHTQNVLHDSVEEPIIAYGDDDTLPE